MPSPNPHEAREDERVPLTRDMELNQSPDSKKPSAHATIYHDSPDTLPSEAAGASSTLNYESTSGINPLSPALPPPYRVYKRRFFGLVQITLLNIIVSWNWLSFAPVSTTSSRYFNVTESSINWLSTGFLFAFVVASPAAVWTLNRSIKSALVAASALMLVGSWIRYAGTRAKNGGNFGAVVFGQLVIGLAQPFVLSAPTRYSDMWFTEIGRISATAVASLGNPFGGALGQLINPFLATKPEQIPDMVLYVAIITTAITLPTILLPSRPPTPPTPSAGALSEVHLTFTVLKNIFTNPSFHLLAWPFAIYTSAFNATSTLLNQILYPYGFSEDEAGIDGALLIVVGLVAAAITSPLLDRRKNLRIPAIKILVPILAGLYVALIFAPGTRSIAGPYAVSAILGAASFSLVPLALELLVEVTWGEAGPEVSSTICWTGGQLGGALLILIMDALKGGKAGEPKDSMYRSLVLQAVFAWVVVPLPLLLGWWGTGRSKRLEAAREDG